MEHSVKLPPDDYHTTVIPLWTFANHPNKEAIYEANRHYDVDYEWWNTNYDYFIEQMAEKGVDVEGKDIAFSGFCSQGDGACFDADVNLDVFLADNKFRHLRKVKDHIFVSIKKNSYAFHYSHEKTRYVDCYIDGPATGATARLDALVEKLAETIESERYSLSCEIYRDLEDSFDSMISDEAVKETLVENDYEFYKDGKQAN